MNAIAVDARCWTDAHALTDHEALGRLIIYARDEAARTGEIICAELLAAALSVLGVGTESGDAFTPHRREPSWA